VRVAVASCKTMIVITRFLKIGTIALSICLAAGLFEHQLIRAKPISSSSGKVSRASSPATLRYRLDASQSNFMVRAFSGGLLWFKGHDHLIRAREFSGEAQLTHSAINPASLHIIVRADSLEETRDVFTPQQKQIINKELRDIVLQPDKYPEIVFKSTSVTGKSSGANQYELKIVGDLTLHGVTRQITIPTTVTITAHNLRAIGEFNIERSDFNVKATSAMHGMIRVRDELKFTIDIVGHQL
jgi:polyisoprenoid-binding protein YceI